MDYPSWESATHDTLVPDNRYFPLESCSCTTATKRKTHPHTQVVALLLSRAAQKAIIGWEALRPQIITAFFMTTEKRIVMNIIQCYAPTNDSDDKIKEDFFNQLQSAIQRYTERDILIY